MDKNNSLSYGNLPRTHGSPENVATTTPPAQVTSVIELRPLSIAARQTGNNGNNRAPGNGNSTGQWPLSSEQASTAQVAGPSAPTIAASESIEWSGPSDNQVSMTYSTQLVSAASCMPLHRMLLSKPVYTASSTPEMRAPMESSVHGGPMESVTYPSLNAPLLTPSIKIHIHRAPCPPIESSCPSPSTSPTSQSQSGTTNQGTRDPVFAISGVSPAGLQAAMSKSHPGGTVAAKLGRRRASSNTTTMGPFTQGTSTLSAAQFPGSSRRKSWDQRVGGPIRRASQALINLASASGVLSAEGSASMGSVFGSGSGLYGECSRRDSRIRMPEIMLMYSSFQRLPMKDFGAEVRASMDVDQFLQQAVLLLDITETSLEGIVDRMLRKVSIVAVLCPLARAYAHLPLWSACGSIGLPELSPLNGCRQRQ